MWIYTSTPLHSDIRDRNIQLTAFWGHSLINQSPYDEYVTDTISRFYLWYLYFHPVNYNQYLHHKLPCSTQLISIFLSTYRLHCAGKAVYFIFFIIGGVGLSPSTAATSGLLYKPQMIDEDDCGAIGRMKIGTLYTTNLTWPDQGSSLVCRGGKPPLELWHGA
jgi:hypothetical protein